MPDAAVERPRPMAPYSPLITDSQEGNARTCSRERHVEEQGFLACLRNAMPPQELRNQLAPFVAAVVQIAALYVVSRGELVVCGVAALFVFVGIGLDFFGVEGSWTARATAAAWLLAGCFLVATTEDVLALELVLVGIFLVSVQGLSAVEIGAYFALWLSWQVAVLKKNKEPLCFPAMVLPPLLFLTSLLGPSQVVPSRRTSLKADSPQASQHKERSTTYDRKTAAKKFPNFKEPTPEEAKLWAIKFVLEDELLAVYPCSIKDKGAQYGYLFLSSRTICFMAKGMHVLDFSIKLEDVEDVLCCQSGQDMAMLMLKQPLLMKGKPDKKVTVVELLGCKSGAVAVCAMLDRLRRTADEDSDDEDSLEDTSNALPSTSPSRVSGQLADIGEAWNNLGNFEVSGLELGRCYDAFMNSECKEGALVYDLLAGTGATEIQGTPWTDDLTESGEAAKISEVTSRMLIPRAPMCPPTSRSTGNYRIRRCQLGGLDAVIVESSFVSHDVPFGEKFMVQERLVFKPNGSGVEMAHFGRVVFLASCGFLQGRIRSSAMNGIANAANNLLVQLKRRAVKGEAPQRSTVTVRVYEVERRTTIFHNDWQAPFLPSDGKARWRWVEETYQKHPCSVARTRQESAAAKAPPIVLEGSWNELGTWELCRDGGVDANGWKYCTSFRRTESTWTSSSTAMSVRRRQWVRTYEQME